MAGTDWPTRQIDDRVEQIEAPNHTAVPIVPLDIRFAEDLPDKLVDPADPTDGDETKDYILRSNQPLRIVDRPSSANPFSTACVFELRLPFSLVYATSGWHCRTDGSEPIPHCASSLDIGGKVHDVLIAEPRADGDRVHSKAPMGVARAPNPALPDSFAGSV